MYFYDGGIVKQSMGNITIKSIKSQLLIIISFAVMFISRVLVISGNYTLPIDATLIQIVYLGIVITMGILKDRKILISKKPSESVVVSMALITHVILFTCVFVNPVMSKYAAQMFQRQGMFVLIVVFSAWIIGKYRLFDAFLKTVFISLSTILFIQFITHISDLQYLNIASVMSSIGRTRGNFGFGHYNTLGGVCVCNILISHLIQKRKSAGVYMKWLIPPFVLLSIIMLLVSASRSSISSLGIYICLYLFTNLEIKHLGKRTTRFLKIFLAFLMVMLLISNLGMSFESFLSESNRFTLFSVALPTFFKSGRTMLGLGYAPTEVYGLNETPYLTYWLDNGYIYTLITTGYIGSIIYIVALCAILKNIRRLSKCSIGKNMICIFAVYLYSALFEATLFTGTIQNYVYIILFLMYGSKYFFERCTILGRKQIRNE